MRLILMGILLVLGISSSRAQNPYTLLSKGEKFQLEDNNYILEGSFYLLSISKELKDNYFFTVVKSYTVEKTDPDINNDLMYEGVAYTKDGKLMKAMCYYDSANDSSFSMFFEDGRAKDINAKELIDKLFKFYSYETGE